MTDGSMSTRPITGTPLHLTEIGFGSSVLGNLYRHTTDEEAAGAVAEAWHRGIRYFDTAPHYGLGLAERRLGELIADFPREEIVVSTKVGRLLEKNQNPRGTDPEGFDVPDDLERIWDFSRDGILRSFEASLERLGLARIDILYVHDPDVYSTTAGHEAAATLVDLRDQGVVGAVGVGTNSGAQAATLLMETDIDLAMLAGRYTLLEQDALDTALAAATATKKSIVAVGVFNSGLLSKNRPAPDATYDYQAAPEGLVDRANRIADVCERHGVTLPEAAIAFPLLHPQVASIALGMRTGTQVSRNISLATHPIPDALWAELIEVRLLRPDAPVGGCTL